MKKAAAAAVLLALMLGVSVWNIHFLDRFTGEMKSMLDMSRACWAAGDIAGAEEILQETISIWYGTEGYTHVFIRHAEVNDVADAFYDLSSALKESDAAAAESEYERLKAHLDSIDTMEHVTVKSVF